MNEGPDRIKRLPSSLSAEQYTDFADHLLFLKERRERQNNG